MYADYIVDSKNSPPAEIAFTKMHGLGNDFVIIDQRIHEFALTPKMVIQLCDRNFGIGCDQLIVLRKSNNFDCQMMIFNPDGSIGRACGNACRCVGAMLAKPNINIQIHDRTVKVFNSGEMISVNMGKPLQSWYEIPLKFEMDPMNIKFAELDKTASAINVGNPHLVFFEQDSNFDEMLKMGKFFEYHKFFPDRINVSFAYIKDTKHIELAVWERGTGKTLACGSAACAVHFIAHSKGLVERSTTIQQKGGSLTMNINDHDEIIMTGSATFLFTGNFSGFDR